MRERKKIPEESGKEKRKEKGAHFS